MLLNSKINRAYLLILLSILFAQCSAENAPGAKAKDELRKRLAAITASHKATVGVAVLRIEQEDTLTINEQLHFPMMSVYKFPLAMAILNEVDKGKLTLSQKVHVTKEDVSNYTWSPIRTKFPDGNIDLTVAELLQYSVSQSDNIACDLLFGVMKGTKPVNQYIHQLGYKQIEIAFTEKEMGLETYSKNWCRPMTMSLLLRDFFQKKHLSDSSNRFLMNLMIESSNDPTRIKGMLPPGTIIAHKTGTGDAGDSLITACNDVGIITMPDGSHIALTVFVSNSRESYDETRRIIAQISKEVFDYYYGKHTVFFERNLYISANHDTLPYRLLVPQEENTGEKFPLLVYLHGSGTRGSDNEQPVNKLHAAFTDSANRHNYPCYILVPQCPAKDAWVWFPGFPNSLASTDTPSIAAKQTLELIHQLIKTKHIDKDRIYLTGFSMGGEGTFDLLTREPELFACAVPLASVADTSRAKTIAHIPIWAFHGDQDKVNDVKYMRMMMLKIESAGGRPRSTEMLGVGHDCRDAAYNNPEVWKWIFEQRKK